MKKMFVIYCGLVLSSSAATSTTAAHSSAWATHAASAAITAATSDASIRSSEEVESIHEMYHEVAVDAI